ncbi:MAG: hypothetical protein WBB36_01330, partial [Chitinophagales bacterium]
IARSVKMKLSIRVCDFMLKSFSVKFYVAKVQSGARQHNYINMQAGSNSCHLNFITRIFMQVIHLS